MAVIIGAGTTIVFDGKTSGTEDLCVISANWGYNPNTQRLYCIGSFSPTQTIERPTQTLSLTIYSGADITHTVTADEDCAAYGQGTLTASVDPAGCDLPGNDLALTGSWYLVNYGFSKDDPLLPGQETWGMQNWVASGDIPAPTYVIRGISEGQSTPTPETGEYDSDTDAITGVQFTGALSRSVTGNVSAGAIGRADIIYLGVVEQVGGSEYPGSGKTGQGSVSVPYNPLWLS